MHTQNFMKKNGERLLRGVFILMLLTPISPLPVLAEEPESSGNPIVERGPELASLFFQPIYAGGKFVIGVLGFFGSYITAIATEGDEEAIMKTLHTTWADPWTLNDAIRNEKSDPLFEEKEQK